jgi:hypothetical protein
MNGTGIRRTGFESGITIPASCLSNTRERAVWGLTKGKHQGSHQGKQTKQTVPTSTMIVHKTLFRRDQGIEVGTSRDTSKHRATETNPSRAILKELLHGRHPAACRDALMALAHSTASQAVPVLPIPEAAARIASALTPQRCRRCACTVRIVRARADTRGM